MIVSEKGSIGPHEGLELELMVNGSKPLSVFAVECQDENWIEFPEDKFDEQVALGKFKKHEILKQMVLPGVAQAIQTRVVLYSLPEQEWRIQAFLFLEKLYESLGPGYRPDLERAIGNLLGYSTEDVEFFLQHLRNKGTNFAS